MIDIPRSAAESSAPRPDRETTLLTERRFIEPYGQEIKGVMDALGMGGLWSDDPPQLANNIVPRWKRGEYGHGQNGFSDAQIAAAMPLLESMGLAKEVLPPVTDKPLAKVVIFGATTTAIVRRLDLLDTFVEAGGQFDGVDILVGQRPAERGEHGGRDGRIKDLMGTDGKYPGHPIMDNPWARASLGPAFDILRKQKEWDLTETDLARIALMKRWGSNLTPHHFNLQIADVTTDGAPAEGVQFFTPSVSLREEGIPEKEQAPARAVMDITYNVNFQTVNGEFAQDTTPLTLVNGAAVRRTDGKGRAVKPRPTTRSTIEEWINRHAPQQKGAGVLFITGAPHAQRMTQDVYAANEGLGFVPYIAATSPAVGTSINNFLAEAAVLIKRDAEANY